MPPRRLRLLVLCLVTAFCVPAAAQAPLVFHGRVLDSTGAAIAGARASAGTGATVATAVTTGAGEFTLTLPPGSQTITIEAEGFLAATIAVNATAGGTESRTITLQVAGFQDSVTVAAPPRYQTPAITSATKTLTPLREVPQSVTIVTHALIADQQMRSVADAVRYVPGVSLHQGENNRDQIVLRGNSSSADFFVNGVRDDVQYYRDLYNLERIEAVKGPNATMFGRGGGGGVINRVTKQAGFAPLQELSIRGGSFGERRITGDVDQPLSDRVAFRLNGMYENDGSFRHDVTLERYGLNPTFTVKASPSTRFTFGYETLYDHRVSDRGVPSFNGRPLDVDPSTVWGNPAVGWVNARVNLASATIEHDTGALRITNRTLAGNYDRGYQNYVPGAVNSNASQLSISAYNNATNRTNVFNQTDVSYPVSTGPVRHTLVAGVEFGSQMTDNFRNTGYFNGTSTSISVPLANTLITTPVTFRQSATDADNHVRANVAAAYMQDQMQLSSRVQLVAGLRDDYFDLLYHDNRSGVDLTRPDNLVSPRGALVVSPAKALSVYGSYTMSYLPSSGDQFSSLTVVTQQMKPEQFVNYEAGAKWDVRDRLSITWATYRLDRTNTRSTDPNDPTRIVQTGSQRTNGVELGLDGDVAPRWQIAGGYAYQRAFVASATAAAHDGAIVAQVPRHSFSLWNRYQFVPRLGAGLGVLYRSDMFAAIDDAVTLPGYIRVDGAVFATLTPTLRLQANVENLFDTRYTLDADNNTNISPGSPRAIRVALTVQF